MKRLLSNIFPQGCSSNQRDQLRDMFFTTYGNPYTEGAKWSISIKRLDSEMNMLSMLDSCYVYNGIGSFYEEHSPWSCFGKESLYNKYLKDYLELGGSKSEFDRMIEIQKQHYSRSRIVRGIYQDSEGCVYNGFDGPDEIMTA